MNQPFRQYSETASWGCSGLEWRLAGQRIDLGAFRLWVTAHEIADAHQIVSRRGEGEHPADLLQSSMPQLAQQPHGFHPAKYLFDPLALSLAHPIAVVAGGALVDGAAALGIILRHVRGDVHVPQLADEIMNVIALVGSQRDAAVAGNVLGHQQRGIAFGCTVGLRGARGDHQPVAVLGQQMPAIASTAALPRLLRASMASGSVVDLWVSLLRFSP